MMIASSPSLRSRTVLMLGLAVAAAVGCGGGSSSLTYRDSGAGGAPAGGASGGGVGGGSAGAGGSIPSGSGGSDITDGGTTLLQDAAPPAPTNTAIFSGTAVLLGPGLSCSRAVGAGAAATDKWCGILRPGPTTDTVALVVVNLTKALAGTPITCAAGDANCLTLSRDLATDENSSHGFIGQTLIYYDKTAAYAWRPGWTAGRKLIAISDTQPVYCEADPKDGTHAICLQKDAPGTGINAYAGSIATQAGAALPAVEPLGTGTIAFSPDATGVLYSVNMDASGLGETLKTQTIGDDTTRKVVAMNVKDWMVSRDATHWFWLSAPSNVAIGGAQVPIGTLQAAPYPAGTPAVSVQSQAVAYATFGTNGVVSTSSPTAMGTDLIAVADADNPTTTTTMLQAKTAFGLVDVDASGNVVYYEGAFQPNKSQAIYLIDLRQITADGSKRCLITADTAADSRAVSLIASSKGVAWVRVLIDATAGLVTSIDGVVTTLADCTVHVFAPEVGSYTDTTTGLVFQNGVDQDQLTADLSYVPLLAGAPATPMLLQGAADYTIDTLTPELPRVLFSINQRATGNGIYVSGALVAGTPDLAPARRTVTVTRSTSSPRWAPAVGLRDLPAISTKQAVVSRFSAFDRRFDDARTKSVRAFAGLAVPALLRRP